jgi:hypothetical protein
MRYSEKSKIRHKGKEYDLHFNENGAMFSIENQRGEVVEWLSARRLSPPDHNTCWLNIDFLARMTAAGVVESDLDDQGYLKVEILDGEDFGEAVLCRIVHPLFNDQGFSNFGDFCRSKLGQQSQYGSRYIDGRLDGYPALGEGLRFNNGVGYDGLMRAADATDYHSIRIHRDDMDEFERRYKAHYEEAMK